MSPKKSKAKAKPKKAARPKKARKKKAAARARSGSSAAKKSKKRTAKKATRAKLAKKPSRKTSGAGARKKATARKKVEKATAKKKVKARAKKKTTAKKKVQKATAKRTVARKRAPATQLKAVIVKPVPEPKEKARTKTKGKPRRRRSSRRTVIRRGPDGEILAPGDLLLPGGAKGEEEIQYLFRGCMAAEHPVPEEAINEVLTKRDVPEGPGERDELQSTAAWAQERFGGGDVEPIIPIRTNLRRTFQGVVDRARQRRREIGAFLRGLDMGHTETSHMDSHGEASLQSLMEWAARLENLVENLTETPEMNQGHYTQFHRVLDQLEATTEALVIDVEQTLRRLRDRG
jgi:hypothetical protein